MGPSARMVPISFSSLPFRGKGDFNDDYDYDLFVHRDTEIQSFVFLKTFVSLNKSLTFDHLRASSYGTHLIAILCLCVPLNQIARKYQL